MCSVLLYKMDRWAEGGVEWAMSLTFVGTSEADMGGAVMAGAV